MSRTSEKAYSPKVDAQEVKSLETNSSIIRMFDPSQFEFLPTEGFRPPYKFGPGVDPENDFSRWKCIYPHYINSKKKISEGRRIAQSKAVENPTADEMGLICEHFNIPYVVEFNKAYPRDWLYPGRIRFLIPGNQIGVDKSITSKKELMLKMGEMIPQLKSRHTNAAASSSTARQPATSTKPKKRKH